MNSGNEFPSVFAPVFTALRRGESLRRNKSAFGVAAFGRKPPFEFPSQFAALCRDAATSARFPCGIRNADFKSAVIFAGIEVTRLISNSGLQSESPHVVAYVFFFSSRKAIGEWRSASTSARFMA